MSDIAKCIDVSHWQGDPDWDEVAGAGVLAVIHKASEGTGYTDPMLEENYVRATEAGLAFATYFWLKHGVSAADQAEFYLETIDPVRGERVVIDYEEDGCTLEQLYSAVQTLQDADLNLQVAVYSGHLLKGQLGNTCDEFLRDNTSLWLAQYTTGTPTWSKATYPQWSLWQYTDQGDLPGIDGCVDFDRFNGSDEQLLKWINPAGLALPPIIRPERERIKITVTVETPEGVEVEVRQITRE